MNASGYTRILVIILAALALAACPGKKNKKHDDDGGATVPPPSPTYYVNATTGVDTNPGTLAAPFKTITKAMGVATTSGSTVQVAPGQYDTLNNFGESFPIMVPAGVLLIGDEPNKGAGSAETKIQGGGQVPSFPVGTSAAVVPGAGSTIAGFKITNDDSAASSGRHGVFFSNNSVTLRKNTVTANVVGVYIDATTNHVITGNRIDSNATGLGFIKGGVGSKVENNVISDNSFGVEYDVDGGDLGGGSAGSVGGNVLTCNTYTDLVAVNPTPITIFAKSNLWDHSNPVTPTCDFVGTDICNYNGTATINAAPATQAVTPNPVCP